MPRTSTKKQKAEPETSDRPDFIPPIRGTWRPTATVSGKVCNWVYTCPICGDVVHAMEMPAKKIEPGSRKREECSRSTGNFPSLFDERYPDTWPNNLLAENKDFNEKTRAEWAKREKARKEAMKRRHGKQEASEAESP